MVYVVSRSSLVFVVLGMFVICFGFCYLFVSGL